MKLKDIMPNAGGFTALAVTIAESGDSRSTYFGISPDVSCIIGGNGGNRPFYGFMSDIWLIEKFSQM